MMEMLMVEAKNRGGLLGCSKSINTNSCAGCELPIIYFSCHFLLPLFCVLIVYLKIFKYILD